MSSSVQYSMRSSEVSTTRRAASMSPVRRSSSAAAPPSAPWNCDSSERSMTGVARSISSRAIDVVAPAQRQVGAPHREVREQRAGRAARLRQDRLGRRPVARLERDLRDHRVEPLGRVARQAVERAALAGHGHRLLDVAVQQQGVGEVAVGVREVVRAQRPAGDLERAPQRRGPRLRVALQRLADAERVERAHLGDRVADRRARPRRPRARAARRARTCRAACGTSPRC